MITVKNKDLQPIVMTIASMDETGKIVWGLLTEELTLGTKWRLERIFKKCLEALINLNTEVNSVKEKFKDSDSEESKKERDALINEIMDKEVKIEADKVKFSFIEGIKTKEVYDLSLLEPIFDYS